MKTPGVMLERFVCHCQEPGCTGWQYLNPHHIFPPVLEQMRRDTQQALKELESETCKEAAEP